MTLVALDARAAETKGRVWIQIACVGRWEGHPSGSFSLTPATFDEMIANHKRTGLPIPVDFEHASEMDPRKGNIPLTGAPAVGWIHDLDNRGAAGLWAHVEWLDVARDHIRAGRYRYVSPTIRFGTRDRVTGKPTGAALSSVALTNQPFLNQLPAIAASAKGAMTEINIPISAIASQYVSGLEYDGHSAERARALALARTGREIAASLRGDPLEDFARRVKNNEATITQLADEICRSKFMSRDQAFAMAERLIRNA